MCIATDEHTGMPHYGQDASSEDVMNGMAKDLAAMLGDMADCTRHTTSPCAVRDEHTT
jgi:hypothetical protein